jgi:uncharacterized protein YeaO (DUF488 family)
MVKVKRVYEKPSGQDGVRILVDRLWPRGVSTKTAKIELWLRAVAPSDGLRTWFSHDPVRWPEFKRRYFRELRQNGDAVNLLREKATGDVLTLVYGARDQERNNAVALAEFMTRTARRVNGRPASAGRAHRKSVR